LKYIIYYITKHNNIINMMLKNINDYVELRSNIENNHNGYAKIGCVAFNPKLKHQCVLRVWL